MSAIRPDFFVIGASKCGTTSLCRHLAAHPAVFVSEPKEPLYFSKGPELGRTQAWYESLFAGAGGCSAVGEGSTNYASVTLFPGIERRIAGYAPAARIVYVVRHPLERMESQWLQRRASGTTRLDFGRAVRELPELIETNRYWLAAEAYREAFGDERLLVLFFEDLRADPASFVARVYAFLGVDPAFRPAELERRHNPRQELREDAAALRGIRGLPGFSALRDRLVPAQLRHRLKRPFTRTLPIRPDWDDATLGWAGGRVAEGNRVFLERHGKPPDFWTYGRSWLDHRGSP